MFQVSPQYLERLAQIESGGNPMARNPNSSAKGLYQFLDGTAKQYGLTNPYDPVAARDAAIRFTQDNYNTLRQGLGRDPSEQELYLAHQQGATGALRLLGNPNTPAAQLVGNQQIALNGGDPNANARQFTEQWNTTYNNDPAGFAMQAPDAPLTPEEQAELEQLEKEFGDQVPRETSDAPLTPEEEAELAQLEAEFAAKEQGNKNYNELSPSQDTSTMGALTAAYPQIKEVGRQLGLTGRYIGEGLAGLADLPNVAINSVIRPVNAATGSDIPELGYLSDFVSKGLDKVGLPQPQGGFERVVGDVSRALVGAGGIVGAATKLAKYAPALTALAENAGLQGRAAVGSAAASGTTREMGGGDLAQLGAGIAGGLAGGMSRSPKATQVTSDDLRRKANQAYQYAEQKGGTLSPEFTNKFLDEAEKVTPQTTAGRLVGGDSASTKVIERMKALRDKPLSLAEAQEIDEFLGDAIDASTELGKVDKQGRKLLEVQSSLRNLIDSATEGDIVGGRDGFDALKEGRQLWSKSAKLGDIERIISRADISDNPATAIRSGFRTLYNNPNRLKGFNKAEREAIRKAAETGVVGETLRTLASRLVPIGSLISGGGLGASALAQAGSMAARSGATKYQIGKANNLAKLIAGQTQSAPNLSGTPRFLGLAQGLNQSKERDKK